MTFMIIDLRSAQSSRPTQSSRPPKSASRIIRSGAIVLSLALLAGACSDSGDKQATGAASTKSTVDPKSCPTDVLAKVTKPVDITFWHSMADANESTLKAMIADYNETQSKVRVNLQFQGGYDDTAKKYRATLQEGDLPELVQLHEIYPRMMIDTKSTIPVQACIDADDYDLSDYLAAPLSQFRVDDIQWSMPFNSSVPVLYYNKAAFKKAGLDPDVPPTTFEEMRAMSQKIVTSGAAKSGIAFELKADPIAEWMSLANQPLVDRSNGRDGQATKATLDSKAGLEIYQFMDKMIDDKLAISVGRNTANIDHLLALAKGDAAMAIFTSAALGSVLSVLASGQFPGVDPGVAFLPGPHDPKGKGGVFVGGGSLHIVKKGSTPEQRAAAWDLTRWLNEPAQQARLHLATGYIPIRKSAIESPEIVSYWEANPLFRVGYDQMLASKTTNGSAVFGAYQSVEEIIIASLERMTLEAQDPAKAIAQANVEATAAIKDYNERIGG